MKLRKIALLIVVTLCALLLASCSSEPAETPAEATAMPETLATVVPAVEPEATAVPVHTGKVVNVYNWEDYIDPAVITLFEKETGIKVNYMCFTTVEDMIVQVEANPGAFDVCFPSDYIIEKLIADDMLHPLNKDNIPNMKHIDPRFMDLSFDPDNTYSVPYMWGTVGILYNTTLVDEADMDTWARSGMRSTPGRSSCTTPSATASA